MNNIVNNFLLVGDKFKPKIHLRQLGFTYSACGPFTMRKQRIQKFMQREVMQIIFTKMNWIRLVSNTIWALADTKT